MEANGISNHQWNRKETQRMGDTGKRGMMVHACDPSKQGMMVCAPVTSALGSWRQKDQEFKVTLNILSLRQA